jgi:hypothetical protein
LVLNVTAHAPGSVTEFKIGDVKFEVFKALTTKSAIIMFWTVSQILYCLCFLHFYPEDAGNMFLRNAVEIPSNYIASYPRKKVFFVIG